MLLVCSFFIWRFLLKKILVSVGEVPKNTTQPSRHTLKNRKANYERFNAEQPVTQQVDSVTSMLDPLEWNSLETCRNIAKVSMLYIITLNLVAINPDFYISSRTSLTRHSQSSIQVL
jgi:hypothetical protein